MQQRLYLLLLIFTLSLSLSAQTEKGDSAFERHNYALAAKYYSEALKSKPSATTYYNLGCTYYRLQKLPEAAVAFQHALHLNPGETDALHNLAVVNASLPDKFSEPSQMFFSRWMHAWRMTQSPKGWGIWGIVMFILCLCFVIAYRCAYKMGMSSGITKSAFALSALSLVLCLTFNVFAWQQKHDSEVPVAVVMKTVALRNGPSATSRVVRQLQPGVTLTLVDEHATTAASPLAVLLPDGTPAWVTDISALTIIK